MIPTGCIPGKTLLVREMGLVDYRETWQAMQAFTQARDDDTCDELWLVEHPSVFTQGQAGKPEHLIMPSDIPLVQSDRGGQVTYHGPGQLVAYPLLGIKRLNLGARAVVTAIEASVVSLLARYDIDSAPRADAPGVYVGDKKIASLGLRIRKGCTYHGVAINISVDLSPFSYINPCGYAGLEMARLDELLPVPVSLADVQKHYADVLATHLGLSVAYAVSE